MLISFHDASGTVNLCALFGTMVMHVLSSTTIVVEQCSQHYPTVNLTRQNTQIMVDKFKDYDTECWKPRGHVTFCHTTGLITSHSYTSEKDVISITRGQCCHTTQENCLRIITVFSKYNLIVVCPGQRMEIDFLIAQFVSG